MDRDHGRRVAGMFGRIAGWYDFLNRFLSLGLDILWRRRLVAEAFDPAGGTGRVLDLAAGTLDVSLELARVRPGCRVTAADFCLPMLARGREKLARAGGRPAIDPVQADALALPFKPDTFDAATIAFGIRNIVPRAGAYAELLRVLKPGGRLCILEFGSGRRRIVGGLYNVYLERVLPGIGRLFSRDAKAYRYLADTIRAFPDAETLAGELRAAGFTQVRHRAMTLGVVCLHVAVKGRA